MSETEADRLYEQVQAMTTPQVHLLWRWIFLELVARWRRGDWRYRLGEGA